MSVVYSYVNEYSFYQHVFQEQLLMIIKPTVAVRLTSIPGQSALLLIRVVGISLSAYSSSTSNTYACMEFIMKARIQYIQ